MKDLLLFTELTDSEQENISGGAGTVNFVIEQPGLPGTSRLISQFRDVAKLPDGTLVRDENPLDDPFVW